MGASHTIAMIAPFGIRPKGTLAARMLPLAQALARRGHRVQIVAPPVHNPQDAGTTDWPGGIPVRHVAAARLPGALDWAPLLLSEALVTDPHVVHVFKPKGYGGLAALLARFARPRVRLVVDTDDWEGPGGWNDLLPYPAPAKALFAWQEADLPRHAAAVTVVSHTLQQQVLGFGVPQERIVYLPNGTDTTGALPLRQRLPDAAPTVLLYTRFWELSLHELVAALVGVVARCPAARLLVVGKGERGEEQIMLDLAKRAGVQQAIEYRGWADPAAIPALLASADVALMPMSDTLINRARGLAKLLELMAAGLPIVASAVGQVNEYLEHERSGLLVAPANAGALAQATLRLFDDAALRLRLGAAAHTRATTSFHWDTLAASAERAYDIALQ